MRKTLCHCGEPVQAQTEDEVPSFMNYALAMNYCDFCASVRCDAYPGECGQR